MTRGDKRRPGPAQLAVLTYVCRWPGRSRAQLERMFHRGAIDRALAGGLIADHGTVRLAVIRATELGLAILSALNVDTRTYREIYGTDEVAP